MATAHNQIKAFLDSKGEPAVSAALRDAVAHTGALIPLGKEGFAGCLFSFDNDLDQQVTITIQGKNFGDIAWHTAVAGAAVAAAAQGTSEVTAPWSELRISYVAAGIPTTGTLYVGIQRRN